MTIFFDLDRTLLDTDKIFRVAWDLIEQKYGVNADSEFDRIRNFYKPLGGMKYYDFFDHIKDVGLDSDEVTQWLEAELQKTDLLFADAEQCLEDVKSADVHVLTYGKRQTQKFKLRCLPQLKNLPTNIVEQTKDAFFQAHPEVNGVLVDDRVVKGLPDRVKMIHIDRTQDEPTKQHETYASINSLAYVGKVLAD